jgi:chromosome segregation ATPase
LQREKDAYLNAQNEHMSIQSKMEMEKQSLAEILKTAEKRLNDEKSKNLELSSQLKASKSSNNYLKQELEDYKLKATKTLQTKDRLISQLKDNANGLLNDNVDAADGSGHKMNNLKSIEIEELQSERDHLKEDLNSKNITLELTRNEMMELESQTSYEIENLKDQVKTLEDQEHELKQSKECLEQDLKSLRQQLDYARDELYKQKTNLNNRLQEREYEIEKLRNQITTKSLGTTTEKELENRLHMLTENLIQKQTLIEALQSEKHSIFLQLERSEKRLQDYESIVSSKKNSTYIRMSDDDNPSSNILKESPFDHEMTRKVKRAATEIDKFSIRLGVFFRRYPIARVMLLFYMFILHLWVVFVLMTYKPEAHDHLLQNGPPMPAAPPRQ